MNSLVFPAAGLLFLFGFSSTVLAVIDPTIGAVDAAKMESVLQNSEIKSLDDLIRFLPANLKMNFVLKHGDNLLEGGPRGHRAEVFDPKKPPSQSANATAPRTILFDEQTGYTISYNGGVDDEKLNRFNAIEAKDAQTKFGIAKAQTSPHRLDILRFDFEQKKFVLEKVDFTNNDRKPVADTSCMKCHGPSERPIFSMYPDWPQFYGSDNDELMGSVAEPKPKKDIQVGELQNLKRFRQNMSKYPDEHKRYTPLYQQDLVNHYLERKVKPDLNLSRWVSYPFRPDNSPSGDVVSRAFSFRPGLRLGIVLNRLTAHQVTRQVVDHENFAKYGKYFLFNLLQCSWSGANGNALARWTSDVGQTLKSVKAEHQNDTEYFDLKEINESATLIAPKRILHYRQIWALFELMIRDVDIRYSYGHDGYNFEKNGVNNTPGKFNKSQEKIMEVGYIGDYFNSYFDGSATIDELVAALVFEHYRLKGELKAKVTLEGLELKYRSLVKRYAYDGPFFTQMDKLGKWIPIPIPDGEKEKRSADRNKRLSKLFDEHHRVNYAPEFRKQHTELCQELESQLSR